MLDATDRRRLRELHAEAKLIKAPKREADRKARKAQRDASKAARKAAPMKDQRQPRVRNNAYLAFLRRQPCLNCGATPCDAAHVRFAPPGSGWRHVGKGEKPDDARAVPLCRACHMVQHDMRESRFWAEILERDPVQTCADLYAAFMDGAPRLSKLCLGGAEQSDCETNTNTTPPRTPS